MRLKRAFALLGVLIGGVGLAACSHDVERAKREYVASGDRYMQQRQVDAAIIEYRNAIQQDPQFGEAYRKLSAAYLNRGETPEAARAAVTAAQLLPDVADAQVEAGGALLLVGKFADAKGYADRVIARDASHVRARVLLGNATAGLKDTDAAIREFEEAIRLDPQQSGVYTGLAVLKASQGEREAAERIFKQAIATEQKSAPARLALAQFYWSTDRLEDAERVMMETHDLMPGEPQVNVMLALFYQATRRAGKAEPYLRSAVEVGKDPRLTMLLADYYIARNRLAEAAAVLEPLAADRRLGAQANVRLAGIAQVQGRPQEAMTLMDRAVTLQPKSSQTLAAKSDLLRRQNNLAEAAKVAEAAVAANPSSAEAQFARGRALQAAGSYDQAEHAFNEVLRLNPRAAAARVELARMRVRERASDAVAVATDATEADPNSLDARLTLVRALVQQREIAKAQEILKQLLQAAPTAAALHAQQGILLAMSRDAAAARTSFTRALELEPMQLEAIGGLTALDFSAGRQQEAVARLDGLLARDAANQGLILITANAHASIKDYSRAEALLIKAIESNPASLAAYSMLGRLYLVQQRLDAARSQFEKMAARQEKPVAALTVIGTIDLLQNRNADAQRTFERVLTFDPKAGVAANNLAWLYLENGGSLDLALHLAQTAKAALPNAPEVNDTLGWAYYKKDLLPSAISALRRSLELDPKNSTTMYHLALAYEKSGERQEARQLMTRYLRVDSSSDRSADVRRRLQALGT
jgi:tetratricopeptide (TPR) repeat protein